MKLKIACFLSLAAVFAFAISGRVSGEEMKAVQLLKPQTNIGKPLMQALKERKTAREFGAKELPLQTLSNLLWAAFGVNRPDGKRTAPSAVNWQEIDIYVASAKGLYLYNATNNRLDLVAPDDIRPLSGMQPFVKTAPVVLTYVANYAKMGTAAFDQKDFYSAVDTGYISQNVYLFCASEGLATVVLNTIDRPHLAKALNLKSDQKIILSQPVGYPK